MLRKDKLYKPCRKCGKSFKPTGKVDKLCEKCFNESMINRKMTILNAVKK